MQKYDPPIDPLALTLFGARDHVRHHHDCASKRGIGGHHFEASDECALADIVKRYGDITWLAGLYEGEGTLVFKQDKRNDTTAWNLSITSTDEDVIRRAHEIAGVGTVTQVKRGKPHWQDQWRWRVSKRADIATILTKIQPNLGERRGARVAEFFEWFATRHAQA